MADRAVTLLERCVMYYECIYATLGIICVFDRQLSKCMHRYKGMPHIYDIGLKHQAQIWGSLVRPCVQSTMELEKQKTKK